jgi:hypothetical protein
MARTRTPRRINYPKPPPMMPTLETPESPAANSTAITDNGSEPGSAVASSFLGQPSEEENKDGEDDASFVDSDEEEDISVGKSTDAKKPAAKRHISSDHDEENDNMSDGEEDLDDEKPVIVQDEEDDNKLSDDEEVLFLGTTNPRPLTHNLKGNSHRNIPMTYCIGNVHFGKAVGHFMVLSNGFDQTGTPRVNFRTYVFELWMRNGKYSLTRPCIVPLASLANYCSCTNIFHTPFSHPYSLLFFSTQGKSAGSIRKDLPPII